jgi:DNA-binding transcriptional regulator/RsmH inhibitor MraZ
MRLDWGPAVTVHRLSPKNQVTIPREARVFAAASKVEHFRAKRHVVRRADTQEKFHLVLLMSEAELQERERRIMADATLSDDSKFEIVTRINDEMKMLALDAQNRVVLPGECVHHLGLGDGRDVKFVCTNTQVQLWNPDHYQLFTGKELKPDYDPLLTKYLSP